MNVSYGTSYKYAKFGRGSTYLESRNGQPLDLAVIAQVCPAVIATEAHSSRSERYTYVSTMAVLEALGKEGFQPFSILQGGSKDEEKRGFTKHLVRFRDQSVARGETNYEVCLLGSHDGTASYQMFGGNYRWSCKNGTIFFSDKAVKIQIPHKGDILQQVVDATYTVADQKQLSYDAIDSFRAITVSRDEQIAFAEAAAVLRFEDESPVNAQALLVPRRQSDTGNDLWTCFNRVQENVIRGGVAYTVKQEQPNGGSRISHRTTRPVRSVDGDVRLNRALWTLTEQMAKIKATH